MAHSCQYDLQALPAGAARSTSLGLRWSVVQAKPRHARSIQAAVAHRASTVYERLLTQLTPQARVRQPTSKTRAEYHCCTRPASDVPSAAQGDRTDCILMSASVSVLVLLAMQMFRLYLHWYQTTGLRPIFHSFPTHW